MCSELSADGRRIALCPDRDDSPVELWDFQTRRRTCALKASAASHAWSASFNPDGSRLAVGRANGDVEVWDTLTGRLYCSLHVLRSAVYDVCFSPDGSRLTAGGYHMGQVYQWVASSDAEIAAYQRAQQTKAVRQAKGGRK